MKSIRGWSVGAVVALMALVGLGSVGLGAEGTGGLRSEIEACNKHFVDAISKGDAAAAAACYTKDATLYSPRAGVVKGREAIEKYYTTGKKRDIKAVKLETNEVEGGDKLTYETGTFKLIGNKDEVLHTGYYLIVWKKGDKGWKMYREIWNSRWEESKEK